ncbi:hypothetical protein EXIGLDRAFT_647199 [Exidia glandulosa HHB12029]|uniref:Small ribosomal subunit protein mS35 mitochondrial conserved domain-containing protein n=1 Tax=Exidia glandulosa HHB12029 TaxID=1314781 RepID=A0A166AJJ7_EXIGL|nr:hypothetical protein EXIGLDRAFT_647199 [Exidia glandulosa HHB12029]
MITRQPRASQAAHAAARLFSTSPAASARAGKASKGGKASSSKSSPAKQQPAKQPTPQRQRPTNSLYLELLARAPTFQNHPAYSQLVQELKRKAERDLGRKLRPEENELATPSNDPTALRNMIFERDPENPDAPSPVADAFLSELATAHHTTNPNVFAGQPPEVVEFIQKQLARKEEIEERKRLKELEESGETPSAIEEATEDGEEDGEEEDSFVSDAQAEAEAQAEEEAAAELAELESPFLEGAAHRKFNPLDLNNIQADPKALSPVAFRMISIQRQFLHYMRLIEGDMFMLQALRQPFVPPPADRPLSVRTISFGGEKHPATRKRVVTAPVTLLPLEGKAARHKLKVLAGPRWTLRPPRDAGFSEVEDEAWGQHGYIKLSIEDFAEPVQNLKFASDTILNLVLAANDDSDSMKDIPIDERHVVTYYKRKPGFDKFGHRPSIADFPLEWLHIYDSKKTVEILKAVDLEERVAMTEDYVGHLDDIHDRWTAFRENRTRIRRETWDKWAEARDAALERGDMKAAAIPFKMPYEDPNEPADIQAAIEDHYGEDFMDIKEQSEADMSRAVEVPMSLDEEEDTAVLYEEDWTPSVSQSSSGESAEQNAISRREEEKLVDDEDGEEEEDDEEFEDDDEEDEEEDDDDEPPSHSQRSRRK